MLCVAFSHVPREVQSVCSLDCFCGAVLGESLGCVMPPVAHPHREPGPPFSECATELSVTSCGGAHRRGGVPRAKFAAVARRCGIGELSRRLAWSKPLPGRVQPSEKPSG